jgi:hypothetical protein
MAVKDNTERLYTDIRRDFDKLSAIREFGVQKFTTDYMLAKIAHQYYKSPKTIENIVFNRVPMIRTSQLGLFANQ